jgi:hypothetical protein
MVENERTFLNLYRTHQVTLDDIDEYVDKWHYSNSDKPLSEYLGMTWEEYAAYVQHNIIEDML